MTASLARTMRIIQSGVRFWGVLAVSLTVVVAAQVWHGAETRERDGAKAASSPIVLTPDQVELADRIAAEQSRAIRAHLATQPTRPAKP